MKDSINKSDVLNPNSASPVLKTPLVITLDPFFPYDLNKDELSVNATSVNNPLYIRYLHVMSVVDTKAPIPNPTSIAAVK
jgi:hypothetical protein